MTKLHDGFAHVFFSIGASKERSQRVIPRALFALTQVVLFECQISLQAHPKSCMMELPCVLGRVSLFYGSPKKLHDAVTMCFTAYSDGQRSVMMHLLMFSNAIARESLGKHMGIAGETIGNRPGIGKESSGYRWRIAGESPGHR